MVIICHQQSFNSVCENESFYELCVWGVKSMLTLLFVMAFAVSGGLYLGTIAFSAYKCAELDKAVSLFQKTDFINLA